jgi:hypothetical protein
VLGRSLIQQRVWCERGETQLGSGELVWQWCPSEEQIGGVLDNALRGTS